MIGGERLVVRDLCYTYPDGTEALRGASLDLAPGERVALLGPNGAGKTTLVLHLLGLLEPEGGDVVVGDLELTPKSAWEIRRRVGLVFQDPDDQLFMTTVRQDVEFGPRNYGMSGEALEGRVAWALDAVGMGHAADRAPHHLSVGERRRVALATVLAMKPEVIVLDEPSANLDPEGRDALATVLASLDQTLLMVTHDLPYAREVCDRALIMNGGRIVADGPMDVILADAALLASNRLLLPKGFGPVLSRRAEVATEEGGLGGRRTRPDGGRGGRVHR